MAQQGKGDWAATLRQLAPLGSRAMIQDTLWRLYPLSDVGTSAIVRSKLVLLGVHDYCLRYEEAESDCPFSYRWCRLHDSW